ncbi:winged helix-turn-helix domain-containing protein [Pullulanibacillus sp. KACC 23026]|uniref:ArsR/SmtB family transcription factor n=1 Tax=Pullulanibacillus sp. KACC 23026 TaxID=3028315 RepID=UPI0023AED4BB|nr:winged helix-turn-helix domain-containing protein [Pullulanibacillus sp. KACC 23026]WEG14459.1 winged helix-turn-helix domain-containing protein [Pullulanibacillus sp. KACC 23026]
MKDIIKSEELLKLLGALSNPYRLKIIAILHQEKQYVSQLARELGISRPLLYLHLQKLEDAKLINGYHEISDSGKAMKYYELNSFSINLTADFIAQIASEITIKNRKE